MNAYNMYLDPDDQQVFLKEAPAVLNSIKQFGLLLHHSNENSPWSNAVLPPSLLYDSTVPDPATYGRRSVSVPPPEEPITEEVTLTSPIYIGPSGDDFTVTAHDNSGVLPVPVLPESFPCMSNTISPDVFRILDDTPHPNICVVYLHAQLANYYYAMCKYLAAHQFVLLSIEQLRSCTLDRTMPSVTVVVEVLRIMCKMCMIKRKYSLGLRIIRQALMFTRTHFGVHNVTYANLLLEYGCLMLNTDKTRKAARVYRVALTLILSCLPGSSIMAALALEAIAYAHYVLEYTSGDFTYALNCAEVAGVMLKRLNHEMCMQAASANRVKALIIEEIAIDDNDSARTREFLYLARDLHMESLNLCERTFGLWNVQTAKHFGNLGRLYQSMQENKLAEIMHRKAIMIKERLLGASDFEVGLSVGHLASLYNYDMERYQDAEQLYLRSVQISLDLFGPTYSGLEYDYRGLQRVYHELGNRAEMRKYQLLFDQWQRQREKPRSSEPIESADELEPTDVIPDDNAQWSSFFQLADDYEQEFKLIFPHPDSSSDECHTPSTSRTNNCAHHGSSTSEASRSTGY
ncbi:unnamed protein product [Dicrocoelium dendriticum]|nr:unnamed protein product [Dicrocoelium dendriticum]